MLQARHVEKVIRAVESPSAAARSKLAASWRRSVDRYGLDPARMRAPRRIDAKDLAERQQAREMFLRVAAPRLDALFGLVGLSGCGVLLTDETGVVLDRRCSDGDAGIFGDWGLCIGADWSEAAEGTNGIGTCLTERRRVTIHRDEHFLARNIAMSCMDAPIFGPEGGVLGALDVSSARAEQTEGFNALIGATVAQTARAIEAEVFRASYPRARIVIGDSGESAAAQLLAIDRDDLVIGATRGARRAFGLPTLGALKPRPASDLFGRGDGPVGLEKAERAAVVRALARANGNVSEAARGLGIGRATLYRRMKRLGVATRN